jgi:hypothetical protein
MRTLTIEELLTWAFVHELPKGGGVEGIANVNSAWRMIADYGTRISTGTVGSGGSENYFIEQGDPSEDAVTVGHAVALLGDCDVAVPSNWNALSDWPDHGGLTADAVARAVEMIGLRGAGRRSEGMVSLVIGSAVLGRVPDHSAEQPAVRMVERAGRPAWFVMKRVTDKIGQTYDIETNGFNAKTQKPQPGSYRRFEFSTSPLGDILGRYDYQVWVAALRWLEGRLADQLVAHRLEAFDRSMTPWLDADLGGIRIDDGALVAAEKKHARAC